MSAGVPTTGVFRRLPCLPSCSVGCGCGRSGTGDKWRGSARLGGRLGGSTRRLGLASATWLVGGSSSSRPPSSLLRRFCLVWLRHPRAHAHATRRDVTRGAVTIGAVTVIAEPAETGESSDVRRPGGAARCSAVTRDGGGCGMAAAAGRGGRAAVRVFSAVIFVCLLSCLGWRWRRRRERPPAAFFSFEGPRQSR